MKIRDGIEKRKGVEPTSTREKPRDQTLSLEREEPSARARHFNEMVARSLDNIHPIICLTGETKEPFLVKTKREDVRNVLAQEAARAGYDIVLIYNPADASIQFASDTSADNFNSLNVELKEGGGTDQNIVPRMVSPDTVNPIQRTDRNVLSALKQAAEKIKKSERIKKGMFIIVDRAELLFSNNGQQTASAEKIHNPALIGDLARQFSTDGHNRMVLIDRGGETAKLEALRSEIPVEQVPGISTEDIEHIFKGEKFPVTQNAISLARGIPSTDLVRLLRSSTPATIEDELKAAKEKAIANGSGGIVTCSMSPLTRDQMYYGAAEGKMWDSIKRLIVEKPDRVSPGILLVGPPGTGKTARAQLLASELGIPFLELNNVSSSGLRGIKEDRFRSAIETAIANKPCVLFIDEIDKMLPKTEGSRMTDSNDDAEVAGYLQRMIGSKQMQGVVIIGGSNDPDMMNEALLRSGRFGLRVAVLPPATMGERVGTFKAVKNQIKDLAGIEFDDLFIKTLIDKLPPGTTTGADYIYLLQEALRESETAGVSLEEALLSMSERLKFEKNPEFQRFVDVAKRSHTAAFKSWQEGEEQPVDQTEDSPERRLAQWEARLNNRDKEALDLLRRIAGLKEESEALQAERARIDEEVKQIAQVHSRLKGEVGQITELHQTREGLVRDAEAKLAKRQADFEQRLADAREIFERAEHVNTAETRERWRNRRQFLRTLVRPLAYGALAAGAGVKGGEGFSAAIRWMLTTKERHARMAEEKAATIKERAEGIKNVLNALGGTVDQPVTIGGLTFDRVDLGTIFENRDLTQDKNSYNLRASLNGVTFQLGISYKPPYLLTASSGWRRDGDRHLEDVTSVRVDATIPAVEAWITGQQERVESRKQAVLDAIKMLGGTSFTDPLTVGDTVFAPRSDGRFNTNAGWITASAGNVFWFKLQSGPSPETWLGINVNPPNVISLGDTRVRSRAELLSLLQTKK